MLLVFPASGSLLPNGLGGRTHLDQGVVRIGL